ncbi:MAG TPA: DMT family transporter [bacterium]|nr:DMT family transporter [bacterium]
MLRRVDAAMLAMVVVWGVNFPIMKITLREMSPMVFNALRFSGATALLWAAVGAAGSSPPAPRAAWPGLIALGLLGNAVYQIAFIQGLVRTTADNSSLIFTMVPLFVAGLSLALRIDRVSPRTWVGIVLAFVGLFLLVSNPAGPHLSRATLAGDGLILLSTLCWAAYTVFSRPFLRTMSPLQFTTLTMTAGTPVLILASLPELVRQPWEMVSWASWAAVVFSTLFPLSLGYIIWYASVQAIGGPRTAVYNNLVPMVTVVASWVLLGETLGLLQAAGAAIVLAGVSLART